MREVHPVDLHRSRFVTGRFTRRTARAYARKFTSSTWLPQEASLVKPAHGTSSAILLENGEIKAAGARSLSHRFTTPGRTGGTRQLGKAGIVLFAFNSARNAAYFLSYRRAFALIAIDPGSLGHKEC